MERECWGRTIDSIVEGIIRRKKQSIQKEHVAELLLLVMSGCQRMHMHLIKRKIAISLVNTILRGHWFFPLKRNILDWGGFQIGKESSVVGPIRSTGILIIGSNVWIGANLTCYGQGTVEIEDNCAIAPDVTFLTGGHEIGDRKRRAGRGRTTNIRVRKGSWICARTTVVGTIESNMEIGEACVVAAGAVVTKNIENNKLIGGVPAKVTRDLE